MKSIKESTPVIPFNGAVYLVKEKEDLSLSSLKLYTVQWVTFCYCIDLVADDSHLISLPCAASLGFPRASCCCHLCVEP